MPRKIKRADIERVWETYRQIQGLPIPTQEEIQRGMPKLIRAATGESWKGPIITGTSGPTRFEHVSKNGAWGYELWVNRKSGWPCICQELTKAVSNADPPTWHGDLSIELKLARRVCEKHWLVGALGPKIKTVVAPSKDEVRREKVERLEVRRAAWVKKRERATNAIKKIDRSLTAYRRKG
jgi:hypothetical protein